VKENEGAEQPFLSRFTSLPREEQIELLGQLVGHIKQAYHLSDADLIRNRGEALPFGIFSTSKISSLESIVKYLKEVRGLKFSKIAKLLNRNNKTIWATYAQASRKMPEPFGEVRDDVAMPASLIADRSLSVLEHIVFFAKQLGHTNHEVALMLHLDDRTIWAVYDRAKKKKGVKQ